MRNSIRVLWRALQGMGYRTELSETTDGNSSLRWSMLESGGAHIWYASS